MTNGTAMGGGRELTRDAPLIMGRLKLFLRGMVDGVAPRLRLPAQRAREARFLQLPCERFRRPGASLGGPDRLHRDNAAIATKNSSKMRHSSFKFQRAIFPFPG